MNQYIITLINGTTLIIKAKSVEYLEKTNCIRFFDDRTVIARFNMNNIAGWIVYSHFAITHGSGKDKE